MHKTLAILTSEAPTSLGGVEHVIRELVKGLELRGYEVLVLHRGNATPRWLYQHKSRFVRDFGDFLISWYLGRELRNFRDRELAAVISNGPVGWYIPRFHGKQPKKFHIYHGTYRGQAEAIRPFIKYRGYLKLKWWDSMLIEKACGVGKFVLCNSDQTREEVRRFFRLRGITIWLPLDTSHFSPMDASSCRKSLGLPELGPIGLFAGSAHPMKGLPIVESMIQSLPDVRWLLVLRGRIPTDLRGKPGVQVFENAPYDLLPTLYSSADFAVFPSRYEPFGYVVAEALACGIPVIAPTGGASRLFLQQPPLDSWLIKDMSDSAQYVAAARKILDNVPRSKQIVVQNARPRIVQIMGSENWWPRFLTVTGL